ncbi:MAG: hypothetical protein MJ168_07155 [Clostridia bacterium]|nr:hypothetical protein [Clostridia bacterium]
MLDLKTRENYENLINELIECVEVYKGTEMKNEIFINCLPNTIIVKHIIDNSTEAVFVIDRQTDTEKFAEAFLTYFKIYIS